MTRLVRPALQAILDAIAGIESAIHGKSIDDYSREWLLRHGIQRGIEIVSEAARLLPAEIRATEATIPWAQIMGSATCCGTSTIACQTR
jgi:uncharacterized protein with HEPN domain